MLKCIEMMHAFSDSDLYILLSVLMWPPMIWNILCYLQISHTFASGTFEYKHSYMGTYKHHHFGTVILNLLQDIQQHSPSVSTDSLPICKTYSLLLPYLARYE